jgi:hypothetical protein
VELVVALILLYTAQCVVWLPRGCVLLARFLGSGIEIEPAGWCLLHPRPSARSLVGTRLPLALSGGELRAVGDHSWWRGAALGEGAHFDPGATEPVELRGRSVRSGSRRLARGVTAEHAAHLARILESLRAQADGDLQARVAEWLDASLDLEALRASLESTRRATRGLAPILDVYALVLFIPLPLAIAFFGAEPVLWRVLPALGVLHVAALVSFVLAHRRLAPGEAGALLESLLAASLYPPILLRSCNEFALERALCFHPATVACVALPREKALARLRTELLRCRSEGDESWLASREGEGLSALAAAMGESSASLFAAPSREDGWALAFCPACHVEYRRASGACTDCETALEAFEI